MIFDFDREYAKEAQETGLGRVITRNGREVVVTGWDCNVEGRTNYNIWGYFRDSEVGFYWTKEGRMPLQDKSFSPVLKNYDLLIEVFDDCLDIYDEDELSNNRFFRNIKIKIL